MSRRAVRSGSSRFAEGGDRWAAIGALDELAALVTGEASTRVLAGPGPITCRARHAPPPPVASATRPA